MYRNTPIRRRIQAGVLCDVLRKMLPEECPNKAELLLLLAKLPSEGDCVMTNSSIASSGYRHASFKMKAQVFGVVCGNQLLSVTAFIYCSNEMKCISLKTFN